MLCAVTDSFLPCSVEVSISDKGNVSEECKIVSNDSILSLVQLIASKISGIRMRPSWSVSSKAKVRSSKSKPVVGQLNATHNLGSKSGRLIMSLAFLNTT